VPNGGQMPQGGMQGRMQGMVPGMMPRGIYDQPQMIFVPMQPTMYTYQ